MTLAAQLEAILFFKAEPLAVSDLATLLSKTVAEIETGLNELQTILSRRGVVLVRAGQNVMLETAPEAANIIKHLVTDELSRDLGKASLEVLSLILYRGPVSKQEIDYVRGVNSSFILRNLLVRGLVERIETTSPRRGFLYQPTLDLISHIGIAHVTDLPEYAEVQAELARATSHTSETEPHA